MSDLSGVLLCKSVRAAAARARRLHERTQKPRLRKGSKVTLELNGETVTCRVTRTRSSRTENTQTFWLKEIPASGLASGPGGFRVSVNSPKYPSSTDGERPEG